MVKVDLLSLTQKGGVHFEVLFYTVHLVRLVTI